MIVQIHLEDQFAVHIMDGKDSSWNVTAEALANPVASKKLRDGLKKRGVEINDKQWETIQMIAMVVSDD